MHMTQAVTDFVVSELLLAIISTVTNQTLYGVVAELLLLSFRLSFVIFCALNTDNIVQQIVLVVLLPDGFLLAVTNTHRAGAAV